MGIANDFLDALQEIADKKNAEAELSDCKRRLEQFERGMVDDEHGLDDERYFPAPSPLHDEFMSVLEAEASKLNEQRHG